MGGKILIVDDEQHVLDSLRRGLGHRYDLTATTSPEDALSVMASQGPFAVIISDLAMPGMDGIKYLARSKEISPNSIRMILTGHGDFDTAVAAVNEGGIFRLLTKPCPLESLIRAIDAGLEQYRRQQVERALLKSTLRGSIKVLLDILNIVNPDVFNRGERVKRLMVGLGKRLKLANLLKLELAGMLSQIGMLAVPPDILAKRFRGEALAPEEVQLFSMNTSVATSLLSQIPRMKDVAEIIASQVRCVASLDASRLSEEAVVLNLCLEYDDLQRFSNDKESILQELSPCWGKAFPAVFKAFEDTVFSDEGYVPRHLPLKSVINGMILNQDIHNAQGLLLMVKGQEITEESRLKLSELRQGFGLPETLRVLVPVPAL